MAAIIYNAAPRRPAGQLGVHWLITIVEGYRAKSKTDHMVRISRDNGAEWTTYTVRNANSKIRVNLYAKNHTVYVDVHHLQVPDPTQIRKPQYGNVVAHGEFELNDAGLLQAAEFLTQELEAKTAYSEKNYARIQVTNGIANPSKNIFLGGKIVEFSKNEEDNTMTLSLENLSNKTTTKTTVKGVFKDSLLELGVVGRYLILRAESEYVCVPFSAFALFYQFV